MSRRCLWLTKGLGRGGAERLLVDLFPLVDRERYEVEVAYVLPWKDNYHAALEDRGAVVHCIGSGGIQDLRWLARLARLVGRGDYDVVHTHAPVPAVAARVLTGLRRSPVIVHTEHNVWDRYRRPTRIANSVTYRANASVIAVSDTVAESIRPWPPAPRTTIETVYHGTTLDSIRHSHPLGREAGRARLGLPTERFLLGNVGNFTPKKNHRALLEAMAGAEWLDDAHLALVGLGPEEDALRSEVERLGLGDRVTFLGSRDDVFEILPLFDLFCLSSSFEGFPIALVEAMATGLPVVATAVGGVPEIVVDEDNGLLVEPGDVVELRRAIGRAISDPEAAAAMAKRGQEAAERLDLHHAATALQEVYERALGVTP